ncbi:hypothetical protein [Rhizobium ruizarguesonis]|nr:hypothetical protein [Rhizobium ruizarguesonis]
MRNPFIPSHSRVCEMANLIMIFAVAVSGLTAAIAALAMQVAR